MTALAMIETMKRLWNHVVPLIGRKRSAGINGGYQKKPAISLPYTGRNPPMQ
jgi:hypothetical protein